MKIKIGLEIHVQLNTKSKLFCGCSTDYNKPNTKVCETCLGMPGSKPRLNKEAVIKALKLALALNCEIQDKMIFSRKTYFYPDLSKNYQITQLEYPLALNGTLKLKNKEIRIRRIQVEEDPAGLQHKSYHVLIDYNRSGIPLVEIVTDPDFESIEEVKEFIDKLTTILDYLGMYDPKNFTLRADVNVNLEGHPRVEIKNITGTKNIEKALNFEIVRQKIILESNQQSQQQTMHFDAKTKSTIASRTKETEEDYGYIFDPDIPIIKLDKKLVNEVKEKMPELPQQRIERFIKDYNMKEQDAYVITIEKATADTFEEISKKFDQDYLLKWMIGPLRKVLNYNNLKLVQTGISKEHMLKLLKLMKEETLTPRSGELVLREMAIKPDTPEKIMKKLGFEGIEKKELSQMIEETIKENKKAVEDYKKGEGKALQFLIGQVVRKSKGQANAKEVEKLLLSKIK